MSERDIISISYLLQFVCQNLLRIFCCCEQIPRSQNTSPLWGAGDYCKDKTATEVRTWQRVLFVRPISNTKYEGQWTISSLTFIQKIALHIDIYAILHTFCVHHDVISCWILFWIERVPQQSIKRLIFSNTLIVSTYIIYVLYKMHCSGLCVVGAGYKPSRTQCGDTWYSRHTLASGHNGVRYRPYTVYSRAADTGNTVSWGARSVSHQFLRTMNGWWSPAPQQSAHTVQPPAVASSKCSRKLRWRKGWGRSASRRRQVSSCWRNR